MSKTLIAVILTLASIIFYGIFTTFGVTAMATSCAWIGCLSAMATIFLWAANDE